MVQPGEHDDLLRAPVMAERRIFLAVAADLTAAAQTRARFGAWLTTHGWPVDQQDDLVLAVSEAVSNGVEHGYGVRPGVDGRPGVIEVTAEVMNGAVLNGAVLNGDGAGRHLEITVRDHGKWRAHPRVRAHRRHGIPIMKACVAEFMIDGTATGTTVVLRSRTVPV